MPLTATEHATSRRLAVLIDGENASSRIVDALFAEIATLGEATARRIYGDAASPALRGWVEVLPKWGIQWQQNFQNTKANTRAISPWSSMPWTLCTRAGLTAFA